MKRIIPALILSVVLLSACSSIQEQETASESNTEVSTSLVESEKATSASHSSQIDQPGQAREDQESSKGETEYNQEYPEQALEVDYQSLVASPDEYLDQLVYIEGTVEDIQVLEDYTRFYLNDGQGRIDVEFESSNLNSNLEEGSHIGLEGVFIGINQDQISGEPLDPIVAGQVIK